jgi:hypothetical protein
MKSIHILLAVGVSILAKLFLIAISIYIPSTPGIGSPRVISTTSIQEGKSCT